TDGARYVRPQAGLIARFDHPLPAGATLPAFQVLGATSGEHTGRTILADGGKALLFRPDRPFAQGETVRVTIAGGALGASARHVAFSTAANAAPPLSDAQRAQLGDRADSDPVTDLVARMLPPNSTESTTDTLPTNPYPRITANVYSSPSPGDLFMA